MATYKTEDGIEVEAELIQGRESIVEQEDGPDLVVRDRDFWEITFPDGTVKEMIDIHPLTGEPIFAASFKEVK